MADAPENLTLQLLREMRSELGDLRQENTRDHRGMMLRQDEHTLHLQSLEERFELLREGTINAIGFAANADRQYRKIHEELTDLRRRVEQLEKAK